jgi:hypothetical protein
MEQRSWYKSRTLWFNFAIGVIGVLEASTGTLAPLFGAYYGPIMMLIAIIGIFLRTATNQPLTPITPTRSAPKPYNYEGYNEF